MNSHPASRHERMVERLGSTGWMYLASTAPWLVLFVALRAVWNVDLGRPADAAHAGAALLTCAGATARTRKGRSTSHPPGA